MMGVTAILVGLLSVIVCVLYLLSKKNFDYWKKKNVPFVKPIPLFGNHASFILLQEYWGHVTQKLCQRFPKEPYFGAFYGTVPVLIVQSPELLKHVLTKDFYNFNGRESTEYQTREVMSQGLFFTGGDLWKVTRQHLSPLFSSGKLKDMFYLIKRCSDVFEDMLDRVTTKSNVIEAKDVTASFTMDCVCSCAFGIETNTMINSENNSFRYMGEEIFRTSNSRGLKLICRAVWPGIFYGLGFKCFPVEVVPYFSQLLKSVFEGRNYQPSSRKDFVDLVLNWKKQNTITCESIKNSKTGLNEKVHMNVDDDLLIAQCISFFGAGFETSATTLSFVLYELAKNPAVQKRAMDEVDEYLRRHGNKINYDCITQLPYLDACISEALRMYPVLGTLSREVMDNCTLPDGLRLNKGIYVHIPVYALHHDPDYFPEPEAYKPERFLPENKDNIKPYTYLPFGEGPRLCIGKRFSKMNMIPALITILKKYRLEVADGMPEKFRFECRTTVTQPRDQKLMLKLFEREGWE